MICYVDHHDPAYDWAVRRKLVEHPQTGALQLVEIREKIEEIPIYVEAAVAGNDLLFEKVGDDSLLSYGVPEEWLPEVRQATEDSILKIVDHLPQEAGEALLELATGGQPAKTFAGDSRGYEHPDASRRFHLISHEDELRRALEYPWDKWTIFLHPSQKSLVEKDFNGPARVTGSAGTGKTIVAIHRAAWLAKQNPNTTILLTTLNDALADLLARKLNILVGDDSGIRKQITVKSIIAIAIERSGEFQEPSPDQIREEIETAMQKVEGHSFSSKAVWNEWQDLFDPWQPESLEEYAGLSRTGMRTRLGANQRAVMYEILVRVREALAQQSLQTLSQVYHELMKNDRGLKFDHVIVDESQDLSVPQLMYVNQLAGIEKNRLFLAGDIGQRIFQRPFSWISLGIEVRGRSSTLNVNYRTSHQIRQKSDKLLPEVIRDFDGNEESRTGTVSMFNGPQPVCEVLTDKDAEIKRVAEKLHEFIEQGFARDEIGLFVRSENQMRRARAVMKASGLEWSELENTSSPAPDKVAVSTMHLAKGLEFRAVIVMACDDEIVPLQERIESIVDESGLEEVYSTERHLLYVACTRAREELFISAVAPESEFLADGFEV